MNTKKKTVLAAALVVAIIALAGVGYAAFSANVYKGTTDSAASNYDVDWVTVALDGTNGYAPSNTIHIAYDTASVWNGSAVVTAFKWLGSTAVTHDLKITIPADIATADANNRDHDNFKLKAEVTFSDANYKLQYKTDGDWTNFTDSDLAAGEDIDLTAGAMTPKTIQWRIVPIGSEVTIEDDGGADGITVAIFTASNVPGATVMLPAITYTVTASNPTGHN